MESRFVAIRFWHHDFDKNRDGIINLFYLTYLKYIKQSHVIEKKKQITLRRKRSRTYGIERH